MAMAAGGRGASATAGGGVRAWRRNWSALAGWQAAVAMGDASLAGGGRMVFNLAGGWRWSIWRAIGGVQLTGGWRWSVGCDWRLVGDWMVVGVRAVGSGCRRYGQRAYLQILLS